LIAGMEKTNVFSVPEGYFEGLADRMLILSKAEELSILDDFSKEEKGEVPAGYFDSLADNIMAKIRAEENKPAAVELRELSPALYSIQNENVFEVPAGYFDGLAEQVLRRIKALEASTASEELEHLSPLLARISKQTPYSVPAGFFQNLSDDVLKRISEHEYHQTSEEGHGRPGHSGPARSAAHEDRSAGTPPLAGGRAAKHRWSERRPQCACSCAQPGSKPDGSERAAGLPAA